MPLFTQITRTSRPASARCRSARASQKSGKAAAVALAAWSFFLLAGPLAAEDSSEPEATEPEAKQAQVEAVAPENSSGVFRQFLATIDDFYTPEPASDQAKAQSAKSAPEAGKSNPPAAHDKAIKKETEALVQDALPPSPPQEQKLTRVGRTNSRVSLPRPDQISQSKPTASEQSSAPRWARGGLLGSLFEDDEPQQDQPAERTAQRPAPQVAPSTKPPVAQKPRPTTSPSAEQPAPREGRMLAKSAGTATKWMNKVVSPLLGRDEPAEQSASMPPATAQASVPATDRQPSPQPTMARQASSPSATRPTRHMPMAQPPLNPQSRPNPSLARTRPQAARPAPRKPSMDPTVAIQFGQKVQRIAPSHSAPPEMQMAASAPPTARRVAQAPLGGSPGERTSRSSAATREITPIAEPDVAAVAPESVLPVAPVDLADVLPAVEAPAAQVAAAPENERTPTLADEYAHMAQVPAAPAMQWNDSLCAPPDGILPQPSDADSIKFASSINRLGLAELTGQARKVNSTKPATEGGSARRSPAIEVARQPQMVR